MQMKTYVGNNKTIEFPEGFNDVFEYIKSLERNLRIMRGSPWSYDTNITSTEIALSNAIEATKKRS